MRSRLRGGVFLAILIALTAPPDVAAAQVSACTGTAFERDAAAAFDACTALLETDLAALDKAQAYKVRARAAHRLGQLDAAISDYNAALQLAPNAPELHIRRGWTHYDKRENDAALARAAHALTLDPNEGDAYDLAASVMSRLGDYPRAKAAYDDALRLRPNGLMIRFHRYQLFDRVGSLREALAELDAILDLPAEIARAESLEFYGRRVTFRTGAGLHRALVLTAMGRNAEAAGAYDRLVTEDPSTVTFASRAENRRQAGTVPEAEVLADIDKAIAYDPDFWAPRDVLARLHFYAKRYDAAAEEFAHAIKLAPKRGELRWWHSLALRKLDRLDEATTEALSAIDVDFNYILRRKMKTLHDSGYFQPPADGGDPLPAIREAVRACVLDERCW